MTPFFDAFQLAAVATLLREVAAAEILPRFGRLQREQIHEKTSAFDVVTEADEAADKEAGRTGMAAPVGLAQRAWPLLNMMEESLREETPVVWGV